MQRKTLSIVCGALILLLAGAVFATTRSTYEFAENTAGSEVVISIAPGESGSSIAIKLEKLGVVQRASKFVALARSNQRAMQISAGEHRIQSHLTTKRALEQLLDPLRLGNLNLVKEGSTVSDVIKLLKSDKNIIFEPIKISPAIANRRSSLEGQLFPATYTFPTGTHLNNALKAMVNNFAKQSLKAGLSQGYKKYSPYEVLTIASMVQIEGDAKDYDKVAGVIYNRLKIGMPLQLNSTVQYALNLRGRIFLSTKATQTVSPYNTYRNVGLPPTPISNPGSQAIYAALNPAIHDYLYFITVKPRDTRFTKSFEEFQKWVLEYNSNLKAGLFR